MKIFKLKYETEELAMQDIQDKKIEDAVFLGGGKVDVIAPETTKFNGLEVTPTKPIHNFLTQPNQNGNI